MATLVEHWWNRSWGTLTRIDLKLFYDDEVWLLEIRKGSKTLPALAFINTDAEKRARAQMAELMKQGEWRQLHKRPAEATTDNQAE